MSPTKTVPVKYGSISHFDSRKKKNYPCKHFFTKSERKKSKYAHSVFSARSVVQNTSHVSRKRPESASPGTKKRSRNRSHGNANHMNQYITEIICGGGAKPQARVPRDPPTYRTPKARGSCCLQTQFVPCLQYQA